MRLIDADALISSLKKDWPQTSKITWAEIVAKCAPTIEAEPVKHGKWKYYNYSDINNPYVGWYECTACKQHEHIKHKFCPNCGAKMDKE